MINQSNALLKSKHVFEVRSFPYKPVWVPVKLDAPKKEEKPAADAKP